MPKIVLPIYLHIDNSMDWNLGQIKTLFVGMCSHPIRANRLRCQAENWADMGTFNTEWGDNNITINILSKFWIQKVIKRNHSIVNTQIFVLNFSVLAFDLFWKFFHLFV